MKEKGSAEKKMKNCKDDSASMTTQKRKRLMVGVFVTPTSGGAVKKVFTNYKECWKHIPYSLNHYFAFLKTEKQLLGKYKYKLHDIDKILMYLFLGFLGVKKIGSLHRNRQSHHLKMGSSNNDYLQAVIDWECARFTKPDKPLNARETLYKFYPQFLKEVEPILWKLDL
jgi:hypothetical protein